MGDTNNANAVSKYINQAQEFIKFESQNAEKLKTQEMEYSERLRQQENSNATATADKRSRNQGTAGRNGAGTAKT